MLLAAGVIITSIFVAPQASGLVAKLLQPVTRERWRRKRVLDRLQRLKYVQIKTHHGQKILVLTKLGKQVSQKISLNSIEIQRPRAWDRRWRILVFDFPELKRIERDILRDKIRQLGFREFQKSIWVLPWPCTDEINFIIELYSMQRYVGFWHVADGPEFARLRRKFLID